MKTLPIALLAVAMLAEPRASPALAGAAGPGSATHGLDLVRHGSDDPDHNGGDPAGKGLNALGHEQARDDVPRPEAWGRRRACCVGVESATRMGGSPR